MRIAYLTNQYPKVSHTFVRREILALEGMGVEVERFSVRGAPEALHDALDRDEESKTRRILDVGAAGLAAAMARVALAHPLRFARASKMAASLAARAETGGAKQAIYLAEACVLVEWLRDSGCQHLHAHFGTNSATLAMLSRLLGGPPYSFTSHGPEEYDRPRALGLPEKIEHAAFVVAISSFGRSQLMRWCRAEDWQKINIVRCGVDPDWLKDASPIPPGSRRLLNIGRLSEQKGQLLLLEAAARIAKDYKFDLRIVGDGEMRGLVEARIQQLGLQNHVTLLGWADGDAIKAELDASRAMVLPSFAEGLPVVLMEALARARPVVTTYVAGIPELVDADCGWMIPAGSVDAIATAMVSVLEAPEESLSRLGREGQQRVAVQHGAEHNARILLSLVSGEEISLESSLGASTGMSSSSGASSPNASQSTSAVAAS